MCDSWPSNGDAGYPVSVSSSTGDPQIGLFHQSSHIFISNQQERILELFEMIYTCLGGTMRVQ